MVQRKKIPSRIRRQVENDASYRCSYCRSPMAVGIPMLVDHIIPLVLGGDNNITNLCLCCYRCNEFKNDAVTSIDLLTGDKVPLYHPRNQLWHEHFAWSDDSLSIIGRSQNGRATIDLLRVNNDWLARARRLWILAGVHPPIE